MSEKESFLKKLRFKDSNNHKPPSPKPPSKPATCIPRQSYSGVSLSEVTEGALQVWRALPEKIRQDPSLASFRQEHERLHGE